MFKMNEYSQVAPWYNTEEWKSVYYNIYDATATLTTKLNAMEQLLIWKARCPFLPSGIESTMSLLNVYIQDQRQYEICSDHLIRLAYSSALMRFVNHMLDKETAKGLSLYQAAKTLGVPEWIIELRHDTAHSSKLPCLELLREASTISLKWLQDNYWNNHKLFISDFVVGNAHNETESEKKITALMNFCVSLSICSHPKCNVKNLADVKNANLRKCLLDDAKELLEDSIDFSNLKIVSISQLKNQVNNQARKLLSNEFASSYVNKTLLSEESAFISIDLLKHLDYPGYISNKGLNKDYIQCFDGLLNFLFTHDLLQNLLLELIKVTQREDNDKKCKLVAKWVSVILKTLFKNKQFSEKIAKTDIDIMSKEKEELKHLYFHWYPNEKHNTHLLFDLCKPVPEELTNINFIQPIISTYNIYLIFFIKDLLRLVRPQLPHPIITKICQLAKVIAMPEVFPVKSTKIYTADDLASTSNLRYVDNIENDSQTEEINQDNESEYQFGIWKVTSKNLAWSACPIGQIPSIERPSEPMEV